MNNKGGEEKRRMGQRKELGIHKKKQKPEDEADKKDKQRENKDKRKKWNQNR